MLGPGKARARLVGGELQDAEIKEAKNTGKYDECGIIKPQGESIAFKKKEVPYICCMCLCCWFCNVAGL